MRIPEVRTPSQTTTSLLVVPGHSFLRLSASFQHAAKLAAILLVFLFLPLKVKCWNSSISNTQKCEKCRILVYQDLQGLYLHLINMLPNSYLCWSRRSATLCPWFTPRSLSHPKPFLKINESFCVEYIKLINILKFKDIHTPILKEKHVSFSFSLHQWAHSFALNKKKQ